jgi:hypothetical protein
MKLSNDSIKQLDTLLSTALKAGIEKIIIDKDANGNAVIRGIDEKQTVALISKTNVPDLDGKTVAITRPSQLAARLNLMKTQGDVAIEAIDGRSDAEIGRLELSAGRTKTQFRSAAIDTVKGVPKNIADSIVWSIQLPTKQIPLITQGASAMQSEAISIASRDAKNVTFECMDTNKDVFTTDTDTAPTWIGDGDATSTSFCQKYPAKTLLPLIKEASAGIDHVVLSLGANGILSLQVNGFDFFVIPSSN